MPIVERRSTLPFNTLIGLSRKAGIKHSEFLAISSRIETNYRAFKLSKRSGGVREIFAPKPGLKAIQHALAEEVVSRGQVSNDVHGYSKNRSIKSHASIHTDSSAFIKIDLENFFPSVTKERIFNILKDLRFDQKIIPELAEICCHRGALPQGSPASPALSNLALLGIDRNLATFAAAHGLKYSRYADDIVISGHTDDYSLLDLAMRIIEDGGYSVNVGKSFFAYRPKKIVLTGISLATGALKVPKQYKRAVRQEAYRLASKGTEAMFVNGRFDPFVFDKVMGRLGFWAWVEPDAAFPKRYLSLFSSRYSRGTSFPRIQK